MVQPSYAIRPEEIVGQWRSDRGGNYLVEYDGSAVTLTMNTKAGPIPFGGRPFYTSENPDSLVVTLGNAGILDSQRLKVLADDVPPSVIDELVRAYDYRIRKEIGAMPGNPDRMYMVHMVDKIDYQGETAAKVVNVIKDFDVLREGLTRVKDYRIDRMDFLLGDTEYESKGVLPFRRTFRVKVKFGKRPAVDTMWVTLAASTGQSLRIPVLRRTDILSEQGTEEGTYESPGIWLGPEVARPAGYDGRAVFASRGDRIGAYLDDASVTATAGSPITVQILNMDEVPGARQALSQQEAAGASNAASAVVVKDIWTEQKIMIQVLLARAPGGPPGDDVRRFQHKDILTAGWAPAKEIYVHARSQTDLAADIPLYYNESKSRSKAQDVYESAVFAMADPSGPFWWNSSWKLDYVASTSSGHPSPETVTFSYEDVSADVDVYRRVVAYVAARAREGLRYARDRYIEELRKLQDIEQLYARNPEVFAETAPGEMETRLLNTHVALDTKLRIVNNALALMDDPGMNDVWFRYGTQIAIAQEFAKLLLLDPTDGDIPDRLVVASANQRIPQAALQAGGMSGTRQYNAASSNIPGIPLSEMEYLALMRAWGRGEKVHFEDIEPKALKREIDAAFMWAQMAGYIAFEASPIGSLNTLVRGKDITGRPVELWERLLAGSDLLLWTAGGLNVLKAGLEGFDTAADLRRAANAAEAGRGARTGESAGRVLNAAENLADAGKSGRATGIGDAGAAGRNPLLSPATGRPQLPPGSSSVPNPAIANKLRELKYSEEVADDLSKLPPADLRRTLQMSDQEFESFVTDALKNSPADEAMSYTQFRGSRLDRDRATRALQELGVDPGNVDVAEGLGKSTEETIVWNGLRDGAEPKRVLEAAGVTEDQARAMFRRSLADAGIEEKYFDEITDNYFSGSVSEDLARIRANPQNLPRRIPLTDEQILQARRDTLRSLGKDAEAEDLLATQRLPAAGGGSGINNRPPGRVGPDDPDFHNLPTERIPPDNLPGGTARMTEDELAKLGVQRQPGTPGAGANAPDGPIDVSDVVPPKTDPPAPTVRMTDDELAQLGAQRRPSGSPDLEPIDVSDTPIQNAPPSTAVMSEEELAKLGVRRPPSSVVDRGPPPAAVDAAESAALTETTRLPAQELRFGAADLVYGPSAGGKLRDLADRAGGRLLNDIGAPSQAGDWVRYSTGVLQDHVDAGGMVRFDLTHMEDIEGALAATGRFGGSTTAGELRYIQQHWDELENNVVFYRNGEEVRPPWIGGP